MNIVQNSQAPGYAVALITDNEKAIQKGLTAFAGHENNAGIVACKLEVKISGNVATVKPITELTDLEKTTGTIQGTYQRMDDSFFIEKMSPEPEAKLEPVKKGK